MSFIPGYQVFGLRSKRTLQYPIIVLFCRDYSQPLLWLHYLTKVEEIRSSGAGLAFAMQKLASKDSAEFIENKGGEVKINTLSSNESENLIRRAAGKKERRKEHVRVKNDPKSILCHRRTSWTRRSTSSSVEIPRFRIFSALVF